MTESSVAEAVHAVIAFASSLPMADAPNYLDIKNPLKALDKVPGLPAIDDNDLKLKVARLLTDAVVGIAMNEPKAMMMLANSIKDLEIPSLLPEYSKWVLAAAKKDNSDAQLKYAMDLVLDNGYDHLELDEQEAIGWMVAATRFADHEDTKSTALLISAALAIVSTAVPKNIFQVAELVFYAASGRNATPRYPLGGLYAAQVWEKYAMEGDAHCMFELACILLAGEDVDKDFDAGLYWAVEGARKGDRLCYGVILSDDKFEKLKSYGLSEKTRQEIVTAKENAESGKKPGVDFSLPEIPITLPVPKRLGPFPLLPEALDEGDLKKAMALVNLFCVDDGTKADFLMKTITSMVDNKEKKRLKVLAESFGDIDAAVEYVLTEEGESRLLYLSIASENAKAVFHTAYINGDENPNLSALERSGEMGYGDALAALGEIYEMGLSVLQSTLKVEEVAVDYAKALDYYIKAGDNAKALYRRSIMLKNGKGCEADPTTSMELCRKAITLGHVMACYSYGIRLSLASMKVEGTPLEMMAPNSIDGLRWIERMHDREPQAETEDFINQQRLSWIMHLSKKGKKLLRDARGGDSKAMMDLANALRRVAPEHLMGVMLFYGGMIEGNPDATYELGRAFEFGIGSGDSEVIQPNICKAACWYYKSATTGTKTTSILSLLALADLHTTGGYSAKSKTIVAKNLDLASQYRDLAQRLLDGKSITKVPPPEVNIVLNTFLEGELRDEKRMGKAKIVLKGSDLDDVIGSFAALDKEGGKGGKGGEEQEEAAGGCCTIL
ncbi:hypothetical protein HDU67_007685 [Dinochytrium kinnereticum]|nr:hypothetical protein HDU67_007685 [Dinochytrium kinnereticum]